MRSEGGSGVVSEGVTMEEEEDVGGKVKLGHRDKRISGLCVGEMWTNGTWVH